MRVVTPEPNDLCFGTEEFLTPEEWRRAGYELVEEVSLFAPASDEDLNQPIKSATIAKPTAKKALPAVDVDLFQTEENKSALHVLLFGYHTPDHQTVSIVEKLFDEGFARYGADPVMQDNPEFMVFLLAIDYSKKILKKDKDFFSGETPSYIFSSGKPHLIVYKPEGALLRADGTVVSVKRERAPSLKLPKRIDAYFCHDGGKTRSFRGQVKTAPGLMGEPVGYRLSKDVVVKLADQCGPLHQGPYIKTIFPQKSSSGAGQGMNYPPYGRSRPLFAPFP